MHISQATLVERGDQLALTANLTCRGRTYPVWFAVSSGWARYLDPQCLDPFVVGALPLALRLGDSIYAAGRMSARLLFALNTAVPGLVAQAAGHFRPIKVRVAQAVDYTPPPPYSRAVAADFAADLDSFCVLADHLGPAVPPAHRLTHLFTDTADADDAAAPRAVAPRLVVCARELHLPLISVASNLEALATSLDLPSDRQFRNVAAALTLQSLVGTYLYSARYPYGDCFARGEKTPLASWDPVLLPLLSTERLRVVAVGAQYNRVQRTERTTTVALSQRYLHVCARSGSTGNCSTCWQCVHTLFTLELLGQLEHYRDRFDLALYRRARPHFLLEMLRGTSPRWHELRALAQERGFRFPFVLRFAAALPPRMVHAVRRRLPSGFKHELANR